MTSTVRLDGTAEAGATVDITEGATARGSAVASGTGTWTVVVGAVTDGTHVYTANATDPAGNRSAAATRTVRVDTVAPDTTIASGPNGPTGDATPTFTFTSNEAGTFECSVDSAAFTACPTPFTTATLGGGGHTLDVRAVDAAGNRDGTPASRSFSVDTSPPDTTLTPITTPGTDNTPTFTFTSEPGATFQCRIDGAAFAGCPTPFTTAQLADGTHTFDVRAVDAAVERRSHAGDADVRGRHDRAEHDAERLLDADQRHDAELHLHVQRGRRELRLPRRRRRARRLPDAVHHRGARRGPAHVRRPCP